MIVLGFLLVLAPCFAGAQQLPELKALYESHQWFQLRTAVGKVHAPAFYRGAAEAAFNDLKRAQKDLGEAIKSAPNSEEAYQAHALLTALYLRAGRYRKALAEDEAMLAAKPDADDARNAHALLAPLRHYHDQSVRRRRSSSVRYRMEDGNLFVPVSVHAKSATYMLDSGAGLSALSESEARRLGLTIHDINARGQDATGGDVAFRLAVVDQLTVGEIQISNVAFLVIDDHQQPFVDLPPGERGILGLPVLLAFETVRWSKDGTFSLSFPSTPRDISKSNLCFEGSGIVAAGAFRHSGISFVLDTGATETKLWPRFAKDFANIVDKSGTKDTTGVTGVGHSVIMDSIALPELTLHIGGLETILRPAHVLLKETSSNSQWYHGNLGLDLLNQAGTVTLDFGAMSLTLEQAGADTEKPVVGGGPVLQ